MSLLLNASLQLFIYHHWDIGGGFCAVFWALPLPRWHIYTAPFQSNSLLTFISPLTLNVSLCRSIKMCGLYDIFNRRPLHKLSVISPHDDSRWKQRSVNTLTVGGMFTHCFILTYEGALLQVYVLIFFVSFSLTFLYYLQKPEGTPEEGLMPLVLLWIPPDNVLEIPSPWSFYLTQKVKS